MFFYFDEIMINLLHIAVLYACNSEHEAAQSC
jgi:hypothetical protein